MTLLGFCFQKKKKEPDIITNKWVSLQMDNKGMKGR